MAHPPTDVEALARVRWRVGESEHLVRVPRGHLAIGREITIGRSVARIDAIDPSPALPVRVRCTGRQR